MRVEGPITTPRVAETRQAPAIRETRGVEGPRDVYEGQTRSEAPAAPAENEKKGFFGRIFSAIGNFFSSIWNFLTGGGKNESSSSPREAGAPEAANVGQARRNFADTRPRPDQPHTGGVSARATPRISAPTGSINVPPRVHSAIQAAAAETGLSTDLLLAVAKIESSFDPSVQTGSYKGLFQLSDEEFARMGGTPGQIFNVEQNALAGARLLKEHMQSMPQHVRAQGTADQAVYLYLMHQQGPSGVKAHYANPNGVAWQNIRQYYKSHNIARQAVTGNVSRAYLRSVGSDMTSQQFIDFWKSRVDNVFARLGTDSNTALA